MTEQQVPAWEAPEEPAGPAPGLAFGGFGARLLAYIVDTLIVGAIIIVLVLAVGAPLGRATPGAPLTGAQSAILGLIGLVVVVLAVGYFPFFWARSGATPGMRLMDLRVVRDSDGGPVSLGQAFLRLVGFWVSSFVFYLGFIWIFIDKRRRGWHDLIAGTVVVKRV